MVWIGITGPMGSGKSTVANVLREWGYQVLDADQLARQVLEPGTKGEDEVFRVFGERVRDFQGRLDRRALGRLVFNDPEQLARLEALIHPLVRAEVAVARQQAEERGAAALFYDVPLLFEKNMQAQFHHIWVITAGPHLCRERVHRRSQMSLQEIEDRTRHHLPLEVKLAQASVEIRNDGSMDELRDEIRQGLIKVGVKSPASS